MSELLREIREAGYAVAVHNDYRLGGVAHTFWLFTHANGTYVKGEGRSDDDALAQCLAASKARATTEVEVALLKWTDEGNGLSCAKTPFGLSYWANHRTNMWLGLEDDWAVAEGDPGEACQLDYAIRIRSALVGGE